MANYATLKAAIEAIITTNGNYEISGEDLRNTLKEIIDILGAGYQMMGVATPETEPGTPDYNVAYIAGPGVYPNFGPATVGYGEIGIFKYNGSWSVATIALSDKILPAYININEIANHPEAYEDASTALADVPELFRRKGVKVVFFDDNSQYWIEMLCYDDAGGADWWIDVENNWIIEGPIKTKVITSTGGQQIRIAGEKRGNLDDVLNVNVWNETIYAYDSAALARAAVPANKRKLGGIITYLLADGWHTEQFIGSSISEWGVAANWQSNYFELQKKIMAELQSNTIEKIYSYQKGYINTGTEEQVNIETPIPSDDYQCIVIPCNPDEVFTINGIGGTQPRVWAWLDSSLYVISRSTTTNADWLKLTAPENAAYLVVNDANSENAVCLKGTTWFSNLSLTTEKIADGAISLPKLNESVFDNTPQPNSGKIVKSGGLYDELAFIPSQYSQGFINSEGKWTDLTTGNRYYKVIPVSIAKGATIKIKGSANGNSVVYLLSAYNPVENGDAGVLQTLSANQNVDREYIAVDGAKYLYFLYLSNKSDRTPQTIQISDIDLMVKFKDTVLPMDKSITEIKQQFGTAIFKNLNVPSGITPVTQNEEFSVAEYGIKSGATINIHTQPNNGVFTKYILYVNGTSLGTYNLGDNSITLDADLSTLRLRILAANLVTGADGLTVGGNAEFNIIISDGMIPSLKNEVMELKSKMVSMSNSVLSDVDIISRNKVIEDAVHAAAYNLLPTSNSQYIKSFSLLVAGDIHADNDRMVNIVKYLNTLQSIDAGVMLGDIAGNDFSDPITYYTQALQKVKKPFLTVIGNHDAGSSTDPSTSYTTQAALIAKFLTPNIGFADLASGEYIEGANCYYYKDFNSYKIRMIVLNQFDYPDADAVGKTVLDYRRGFAFYSQAQINWLISTLGNTPNDYHVIICLHYTADNIDVENSLFTSEKYAGQRLTVYNNTDGVFIEPNANTGGQIIADIVNAWINKTTLNYTYTYGIITTQSPLIVNADFSSRIQSNFVCYIGGHWHNSIMSKGHIYASQKQYNVDWAKCAQNFSDTPRLIGTRSEDCFVVLTVDTNRKRVNLLRIGAHWTEALIDRLAINFEY